MLYRRLMRLFAPGRRHGFLVLDALVPTLNARPEGDSRRRRLDMSCMAHSVEPRCPFLDRAVRAISDGLGFHDLYDGYENKVALRRAFAGVLPPEVLHRSKTSLDVGSGIRGEVVRYLRRNGRSEREELRQVWDTLFRHESSRPYFHAYPVFDAVIDRRGETHR